MSWLFGKGKKKPEAPKPEDCSESIGKTIEDLKKKDEFLEKKINDETVKAKSFLKSNNKKKAAECLKRRKVLQVQQEKIMAMQNNLLLQQDQIQQAALNAQVFNQYRQTNDTIKNQFKDLDADKIADIIDDMDETQQNMEEISDALTRPMGPQVDEDEINDDMDALMAEMEDGEDEEIAAPAAPAKAKPQKVAMAEPAGGGDDDEINGLMASFS